MNTMPTIRMTEEGPEVGVATAHLLLDHALEKENQKKEENQNSSSERPDPAQKRALNELTGASCHLPHAVTAPNPPPAATGLSEDKISEHEE